MADKKKIGLYFGSFNPIHRGHIDIACSAIDQHYVDAVWFVVSPNNPFKNPLSLAPDWLRYQLVMSAISYTQKEGSDWARPLAKNLKGSLLECDLPRPTFTYASLREFRQRYPDYEFSVIIGGDNLCRLNEWKNYEEIVANHQVLVYKRLGPDYKRLSEEYPMVKYIEGPELNVSATAIRLAIMKDEVDKEHHWEWFDHGKVVFPDTVDSYKAWFAQAHKYLDDILTIGYQDEKFHTWVDSRYRIDKVDEEAIKDLESTDFQRIGLK